MGARSSALSDGTNSLLRLGATPVTSAGDILELFDLAPLLPKPASLGETAHALLERLREGALTADELLRVSGVDPAQAGAALMELELARADRARGRVYRASV